MLLHFCTRFGSLTVGKINTSEAVPDRIDIHIIEIDQHDDDCDLKFEAQSRGMRFVNFLNVYRFPKPLRYRSICEDSEMPESKEFNREGEADVKEVVSKTTVLGLLPVMYIVVAILIILGVALWWAAT